MSDNKGCTINIGAGCIPAAIISAALNHSFWWGLLHFFCGWFYVLYAVLARGREIIPALKAMFGIQ